MECYRTYDAIITPTLTQEQQKDCNKIDAPLSAEDAKELFAIKCKVQLE